MFITNNTKELFYKQLLKKIIYSKKTFFKIYPQKRLIYGFLSLFISFIIFLLALKYTPLSAVKDMAHKRLIAFYLILLISFLLFIIPSAENNYYYFIPLFNFGYSRRKIKLYSMIATLLAPFPIIIIAFTFFLFGLIINTNPIRALNLILFILLVFHILITIYNRIKYKNIYISASIVVCFFMFIIILSLKVSTLNYIGDYLIIFSYYNAINIPVIILINSIVIAFWYIMLPAPLDNNILRTTSLLNTMGHINFIFIKEITFIWRNRQAMFQIVLSYLMMIIPFFISRQYMEPLFMLMLYYFAPVIFINQTYSYNFFGYEIEDIENYTYFPYSIKDHLLIKIKTTIILNILTISISTLIIFSVFYNDLANALLIFLLSVALSSGLINTGIKASMRPMPIPYEFSISGKTSRTSTSYKALLMVVAPIFAVYLLYFFYLINIYISTILTFFIMIIWVYNISVNIKKLLNESETKLLGLIFK